MLQVVLKTLKDAGGTYPFPGGTLRTVDLTCGEADVLSTIQDVIIDSSFNTYGVLATGRISALKITSACDNTFVYAIGNRLDLQTLQICCLSARNFPITLGCNSAGLKEVYNILGEPIGTATTPAEYVTVWNSDPTNQIIGKLYVGSDLFGYGSSSNNYTNWTFVLQHKTGNYRPLNLQCTTEIPPPISYVYWDYFTTDPTDLNALTFTHSQVYNGGEISVPINDMPYDTYFVLKYPLTEPNFLHWKNSDFQGVGDIEDFVFRPNIVGTTGKFLKTRNASSFEIETNLTFTH